MKIFLRIALIVFFCTLWGCSWFQARPEPPIPIPKIIDAGKLVHLDKLTSGSSLLIVPFSAGENVVSTEDLDAVSYMIVKGAADAISGSGADITVLDSSNADQADILLRGHISELRTVPLYKRMFGGDRRRLAVTGELVHQRTGKLILFFSHALGSRNPGEDFKSLGEKIGRDVGKYILSNIQK